MRQSIWWIVGIVTLALGCSSPGPRPLVIAHRGASGYLPEHTLEAVAMAHGWDVDFVEPDVVMTRDHQLVVLHDIHLDETTNVKEVFPDRKRPDGRYYVVDFDLPEIRQLRAHERTQHESGDPYYPKRFPPDRGAFRVATLREYLELVRGLNQSRDREVGVYLEIKHPAFHEREGRRIVEAVLKVLQEHGYEAVPGQVVLQSFDPRCLETLHEEFEVPYLLVQLIGEKEWQEAETDYAQMQTPEGLDRVATYADGIGPWLPHVARFGPDGAEPTGLVDAAHARGLVVHTYTARADALPEGVESLEALFEILYEQIGVDGVFTDFGDRGMEFLRGR